MKPEQRSLKTQDTSLESSKVLWDRVKNYREEIWTPFAHLDGVDVITPLYDEIAKRRSSGIKPKPEYADAGVDLNLST